MRIMADQAELMHALTQVVRVVAPQNTVAHLSGVELSARDHQLRLYTTDLTTAISVTMAAEVLEAGSIVLPAAVLNDLIHRVPTATVEVTGTLEDGRGVVKYGRNQATIHGYANETLPVFPDLGGIGERLEVPGDIFPTLARQTLFAAARDESRPILKGVALAVGSGRLVAATTDGSRLSQTWWPVPEAREAVTQFVVPAKTVIEAARLGASTETVSILLHSQFIQVETAHTTIISRLLEGQFPEYQRVIPQEFTVQTRLELAAFKGAVERVNLIASRDHGGSIRMRHELGQLEISSTAQDVGQAIEWVSCVSHGPELDLLFNPQYVLDVLKSMTGDEICLDFSGVQSPARFREAEGSPYVHVLLPLRQLV